MVEDWISNAYEGMSRRQFLARTVAAGATIAGFAVASKAVAGEIITTPADGLAVTDGKVGVGGVQVPIYEAHPAAPGKYPVVIVIPEIWGMHEYIKDVVRRFAKRGFLAVTFEPYARTGGVLQIEDREALMKVVNAVPDAQVMATGGTDTVVASLNHTLAANVENLELTGAALIGTGNALNNILTGTSGNNTLTGLAGNDTLIGGAGQDTVDGGVGNDQIEMLVTVGNVDVADGGVGIDTLAFVGIVDGDGVVVVATSGASILR